MRTAVGGVVARSLAASQRGGAAPACNNKIIAIQAGADGIILSRKYLGDAFGRAQRRWRRRKGVGSRLKRARE